MTLLYHGTYRRFGRLEGQPNKHPSTIGVWFTDSYEAASRFATQASRRFTDSECTVFEADVMVHYPKMFDNYTDFLEAWQRAGYDSRRLRRQLIRQGYDAVQILDSKTDFPIQRIDIAVFSKEAIRRPRCIAPIPESEWEESPWD